MRLDQRNREEEKDYGAPTPERADIANGSLQKVDLFAPNSRVPIATAYRVTGPIAKMFQDGRISQSEQQAAELFYRDYIVGNSASGLTMKYGERMGAGGTPLAQQANTDRLSPEERRTFHHNRFHSACRYIGHKSTSYWLTAIVCEIAVGDEIKPPSLEDVGRAVMGYDCRKRAQASGATLIKSGLERLTDFYGIRE